jgi:tRNA splicing ligase
MKIWKHKGTNVSDDFINTFKSHEGVKEKTFSEPFENISSFNFTRNVFFDRSWDDVVVKARGMFINTETSEVAARGYDKFFNVGEVESTQSRSLCENLKFPIHVFVKENGFLGLIGLNGDQLLITSKGTPESPFAELFRKIFNEVVDEETQDQILSFIKDEEVCLVCEVIDPHEDPHMIYYSEPQIILLDIFHRNTEMERFSHGELQNKAQDWGLGCKELYGVYKNWESFWRFYEDIQKNDCLVEGEHVEGFVIEDTSGFMTKIKLPYYNFWKRMRSVKDRVRTIRGTNKQLKRNLDDPKAKAFYEWCLEESDEELQKSIIYLREKFENEGQKYLNKFEKDCND